MRILKLFADLKGRKENQAQLVHKVRLVHKARPAQTAHKGRKQPFDVKYSIDAGMLPVFSIADYWCARTHSHTLAHS